MSADAATWQDGADDEADQGAGDGADGDRQDRQQEHGRCGIDPPRAADAAAQHLSTGRQRHHSGWVSIAVDGAEDLKLSGEARLDTAASGSFYHGGQQLTLGLCTARATVDRNIFPAFDAIFRFEAGDGFSLAFQSH